MERIAVTTGTPLVVSGSTPSMLSIEGAPCRIYMGAVPSDPAAGHLVDPGYQIIIPADVAVFGTSVFGGIFAVVGPFGA